MRRSLVLRGLLLTGSVLAAGAASGGPALACNPSVVVSGPGSSGNISNSGTVDCVVIKDHAVVNGDVTNEQGGTIGATGSPEQAGIAVHDATINGAIVNRGVISTAGPAISITGKSAVTGGVRNDGDARVDTGGAGGNAQGISVSGATMTGGITNTGTIIVTTGKGRAVGIGIGQPPTVTSPPQEPQQ